MRLSRRALLTWAAVSAGDARTRHVQVETVYRSPGPHPNGLQATSDGLWVLDQGDNHAYLVAFETGKVLRDLKTESVAGSGVTFDGEALWIASTYSSEILRVNAHTGAILDRHPTPGAGPIQWPHPRKSPLAKPVPAQAASAPVSRQTTGAHGLEWKNGRLWVAVPPSRTLYRIHPQTWQIEQQFPTIGDRPHGLGWQGECLWLTDTNDNAFYKLDPRSGKVLEKIQLADSDPLPHGMTIWNDVLWYCDDQGVVCRLKL